MSDVDRELWTVARPWFHEHFRFSPDGEDLIWAKAIWPNFLHCGLFSNQSEEAEAWTLRNIQALAILYAGSANAFGTPDYIMPEHFTAQWMNFFSDQRQISKPPCMKLEAQFAFLLPAIEAGSAILTFSYR